MRSKVHIKSHPLHPILVAFPIAFFTGAFLSDVFFVITHSVFFSQMARYLLLGGILFALVAAIPGIVDYFAIVPPESSAMKRATKHAILNFTMLFIFAMALLLRKNNETPVYFILLLEFSGVVTMTVAGWLGGTLVHRNQIGIDHRYAEAGKWQEEKIITEGRIELREIENLAVNQMKLFHINGIRIVIGRTESGFVAFDDHCTHRGGTLADGVMICSTVQCPWHGSQFNVETGGIIAGPAKEPIKVYIIENTGTKYYLQL